MMIEVNGAVGTIDLPNIITSSEGENITVGQTTTITYSGVSPKIMAQGTGRSEIMLWKNSDLIDYARTCSTVRGAYLDCYITFTPKKAGTYVFKITGGYYKKEQEILASLTVVVGD